MNRTVSDSIADAKQALAEQAAQSLAAKLDSIEQKYASRVFVEEMLLQQMSQLRQDVTTQLKTATAEVAHATKAQLELSKQESDQHLRVLEEELAKRMFQKI